MSSKGIFDSGSSESDKPAPSPFGTPSGDADSSPPSPFAAAGSQSSPFAVAGDSKAPAGDLPMADTGKQAGIPEKPGSPAGGASPFSLAEPSEGYGMEPSSPFGGGGSSFESAPSPFAAAPADAPPAKPAGETAAVPTLKSESPPAEAAKPAAAENPASKQEPKPEPKPEPKSEPKAAWPPPQEPAASPAPAPAASAPASTAGAVASRVGDHAEIRQLELRAIFGVDRELSADEIVQRLQTLAGVRRVTRIGPEELGAMDLLRRALAGMANTATPLTLSFGSAPVEFIREGDAVLAVMTDGSFAPGVKETIIIAARELDRMS
jgi:hypothetical protein